MMCAGTPMRTCANYLAAVAGCLGLMFACAAAAEGTWRYDHDFRGHPEVKFLEAGKEKFYLGCGHAVGLWVAYPGPAAVGDKVTITVANGKNEVDYQGEIAEGTPFETSASYFLSWNLGVAAGDPRLNSLLDALLDLLGAGTPVTVSTGGASYELPAPQIANLKRQFRQDCPGF
jgi:hypothetical protein